MIYKIIGETNWAYYNENEKEFAAKSITVQDEKGEYFSFELGCLNNKTVMIIGLLDRMESDGIRNLLEEYVMQNREEKS